MAECSTLLDMGCGTGNFFEYAFQANPGLNCLGIDNNNRLLDHARAKFINIPNVEFLHMDARKLEFPDNTFDLIHCRLVLWALGTDWTSAVKEAFRVLKPGGFFYSFEPDDTHLQFYPPKAAIQTVLNRWQAFALLQGRDPFIGVKVYSELVNQLFQPVSSILKTKVSVGRYPDDYRIYASNLKGLFLNEEMTHRLEINDDLLTRAILDFDTISDSDLICEGYFVNISKKQHG